MLSYHTLLLFLYANRDLDKLTLAYFGTIALLAQTWLSQTPVAILASFPMTPCSMGVKLSRGLVLTSCWARSNCNLVLNYAGSPRRLLRQKLQDGKCISFARSTKRPMCNIRQNGWCITQGTQPERRMTYLESRSYNKSYHSTKAYYFSEIDNRKPFSSHPILAWLPLIVLAYRSLLPKCTPWFVSTFEPHCCGFTSASL
jgi:hypothetical protein